MYICMYSTYVHALCTSYLVLCTMYICTYVLCTMYEVRGTRYLVHVHSSLIGMDVWDLGVAMSLGCGEKRGERGETRRGGRDMVVLPYLFWLRVDKCTRCGDTWYKM